jgi:hypothetical protein
MYLIYYNLYLFNLCGLSSGENNEKNYKTSGVNWDLNFYMNHLLQHVSASVDWKML